MNNKTSITFLTIFALALLLFMQNQRILAATPQDVVSRGLATKLLLQARTKKLPYIKNVGRFPDVPDGRANAQYLLAAQQFGIISEDEKGNLHPDDPVTRAEYLKMITLTFGLTSHTQFLYNDVSPLSWYAPYAGIAFNYGVFGCSGSFLNPSAYLTSAEATRALQLILDSAQDSHSHSLALMSAEQEQYHLNLFENISTLTAEHALVNASLLAVNVPSTPVPGTARTSASAAMERVMILINAERVKRGIAPLHPDALLAKSAQDYAQDMLAHHFFSHVSPAGKTLEDRMLTSGYYNPSLEPTCNCVKRFVVGENIAQGQKTAEEVVQDWMNSPSHRETLLNPQFTDTGVGVAAGIWVQHFGGVERSDER